MGLSWFVGLGALMLVVTVVLMIIIVIISLRLSEERENNVLLRSMLEKRECELRALRGTHPGLSGRRRD